MINKIPYVNLSKQWASERKDLLKIIDNTLRHSSWIGGEQIKLFENNIKTNSDYSDTNFGSTDISYNYANSKASLHFDISKHFNENQYNESKKTIEVRLKANIAQDLYDYKKFYEIINELNITLQKSLEIINNDKAFSNLVE